MPTNPFDREVPEPPDFASLFPVCAASLTDDPEHDFNETPVEELRRTNHMTALDASRLWRELHLAYHDAVMDVALFGGAPYTPTPTDADSYLTKRDWALFWTLPTATWSASEEWRNKFAHGFLHLADDLAAGVEPRPRNVAEALALAVVTSRVFGPRSHYGYEEAPYHVLAWDEHDGVAPAQPFDLTTGLAYASSSPLNPTDDVSRPHSGAGAKPDDVQASATGTGSGRPLLVAPADVDDWHSPTDRPNRIEPYIHRRERTDEGYPDWASLFPACPCGDYEECPRCSDHQLTPRTALALAIASNLLNDYALSDISMYGDEAVENQWMLFSRYPHLTWYQDARWRTHAAEAFRDLGDDLCAGKWPLPQTHAEEMALHLMFGELDYVQDIFDDTLNELPAHPLDYDTEHIFEGLFQDEDILMLFDMPDLASPSNMTNATMYMGDMRPNSWFKPFGQFQPRKRPEPDTSNVTPIRRDT